METAGQVYREQGAQALAEGALDHALDLLSRAVMADGRDAEAKGYLAVVYSRKGLAAQARRTIQSALELQPNSPELRYWLGAILERDGDTDGAAIAYRECLRRSPEHPAAAARLELMGVQPLRPDPEPEPELAAAPEPPLIPAPPSPLSAPPPITTPRVGPRGTVQCPTCREWSKPGLSCEWCSGPLRTFIAPPYVTAPPAAAPLAPAQPFAPPVAPGPQFAPPIPYGTQVGLYRKAHRAGSVTTLGVAGVALCFSAFVCPPMLMLTFLTGPAAMICSIAAWSQSNSDLAEMDSGLMDERGRSGTQTARVLGIIGTSISGLILTGWLFLMLFITRGG